MIKSRKTLVQRMHHMNNKSLDRSIIDELSEMLHLLTSLVCSHITNSDPQHTKNICYCVLLRLILLFQS